LTGTGLALLIVAATAFSTLAIFMKVAFMAGVNLTSLLAFRFLFSAVFCFSALVLTGKSIILPQSQWRPVFLLGGVVHVAVSVFYTISVHRLPASLTGLVFYLYPAMVTALTIITRRESLNRFKLIALAICFAGLLQVMGVSWGAVSVSGLLFGVAAAFMQACHVLLSHTIVADLSPLTAVGWSALATSTVFFLYGAVDGSLLWNLTPAAWLAILGTGFFANFIGIVCFFAGMKRVGPSTASIVMNLEPVLTVVLSVLLLSENFSWGQAIGGGGILLGLYLLQRKESSR
jgi:drug/metabolite transporter (DMT)-like permease